jgi:hypothetical protein
VIIIYNDNNDIPNSNSLVSLGESSNSLCYVVTPLGKGVAPSPKERGYFESKE